MMAPIISYLLKCLYIFAVCGTIKCQIAEVKKSSSHLDTIISRNEWLGRSTEPAKNSQIWKQYEFGSTFELEEIQLTSISIKEDLSLPKAVKAWRYVDRNDTSYLVGITDSVLSLYEFDRETEHLIFITNFSTAEKISTLEVISTSEPDFPSLESRGHGVFLVVCLISTSNTYSLQWLRPDHRTISPIWTSPMMKPLNRIKFFTHNGNNKLLLQYPDESSMGNYVSPIEIYNFKMVNDFLEFRLCNKFLASKVLDIQQCPTRDRTILSIQTQNNVALYEYEDDTEKKCIFKLLDQVAASDVTHSVCFRSVNTLYLATSGLDSNIYEVYNGHIYDTDFNEEFNEIQDSKWVLHLPVATYREESIVILQLENTTIVPFTWNGHSFKRIHFPISNFDGFNLTDITVIPNFGFIHGNKMIKLFMKLSKKNLPLMTSKNDEVFELQSALENLLEKQDLVIQQILSEQTYSDPGGKSSHNFPEINGNEVRIKDFNNFDIRFSNHRSTINSMISIFDTTDKIINKIEQQLSDISDNLKWAYPKNSSVTELKDIRIFGDFEIKGTLTVSHGLDLNKMNGFSVKNLINEHAKHENIIRGSKTFPTIEYTKSLTILNLNGIPLKNISFSQFRQDYSHTDFSKYKKIFVKGNLNFIRVLDFTWTNLMERLIFKNMKHVIMGNTTILGNVYSNNIEIDHLNLLDYPEDYILKHSMDEAEITGSKSFQTLRMYSLGELQSINGIPIKEFVLLNEDQTLEYPITFEDIEIDQSLVIDGKITGKISENVHHLWTLNDTTNVNTKIIFNTLKITGNIYVDNTVNGYHWSKFDDLIMLGEKDVQITGQKTFLNDVEIMERLTILSGLINGHAASDFVTVDTDQEFPLLTKISGNVLFGNVIHDELVKIEQMFNDQLTKSELGIGINKNLIFLETPIVDELKFSVLNNNMSSADFYREFSKITQNVYFETLSLGKLVTQNFIPNTINGVKFKEFEDRRIKKNAHQILSGVVNVDYLESKSVQAETINGNSMNELDILTKELEVYYDEILSGKRVIKSLQVSGIIKTNEINNQSYRVVYKPHAMENLQLENNTVIHNMYVDKFVNGLNFGHMIDDAVLVTDEDVVIRGKKSATKIECETLNADFINEKSVDNILDLKKHQNILGPLVVKGSVMVHKDFNSEGKIGRTFFKTLPKIIKSPNSDTYEMHGSFHLGEKVQINNLITEKKIQHKYIEDIFKNIIFLNDTAVSINGNKSFTQSVEFFNDVFLMSTFNNVDLKRFYNGAIMINRPFQIVSNILFTEDVIVENQLYVENRLETHTIAGVDVNNLRNDAIFLNESFSNAASLTFTNVIFNSDVNVETFNDIPINALVTHNTEQVLPTTLKCVNIIVDKFEVQGFVNGENLTEIYENTFTITDNQKVTGQITFQDHVYTRDFNSKIINNIDVTKTISLNHNSPIVGNFIFDNVVFNGNIQIMGTLNGVETSKLPANTIVSNSSIDQVITGNWTIHGSVHFGNGRFDRFFVDGLNVNQLPGNLGKETFETEIMKPTLMESKKLCLKADNLKKIAENQMYKFKDFDYLVVLQFNNKIQSVHHFNNEGIDYLLVNFETCFVDILKFGNNTFERTGIRLYLGRIYRWITLVYQNHVYFVTLGMAACGRSTGNVWILENYSIKHLLDLGNVIDIVKIDDDVFGIVTEHYIQKWKLQNIFKKEFFPVSSVLNVNDKYKRFIYHGDELVLASRTSIYNFDNKGANAVVRKNPFGTNQIMNITAGIYQTHFFLIYDELINRAHTFISINNIIDGKVLQTIPMVQPSSFQAFRFEGFKETLLVFIENRNKIQIYEYKGIQGFQQRTKIVLNAEKLKTFDINSLEKNAKRKLLAVVYQNKLTILEAKMYGDRIHVNGSSFCDNV